jgi:glycine dehydrogenase
MALQTREQHIRRDKATSNICTAQALLAIMASMYAVYHGPDGLKNIAQNINKNAFQLAHNLKSLGYTIENQNFFDTINITLPNEVTQEEIKRKALESHINFRYSSFNQVGISINETTSEEDILEIFNVFKEAIKNETNEFEHISQGKSFDDKFERSSSFLTHPVFHSYHSESEMMRYIKSLENKDISLTHSMISLGSCTMKLNAASELYPISMPEFANLHPFVPKDQASGYHEIIDDLEKWLCEVTGFAGMSFQPNSGAQGEYAGLMVIREYHISRGEAHRNVAIIPSSAHGTNPASAVMAGMKVVVVKCDENGNIDLDDLKAKSEANAENLSALMVTYPSTHGVFEESIIEITETIHKHGGQVYMDGANMNAQVGLTNPANIGADVCHLNLHKTFAIPHGGGGPGVGPIGVARHLTPFLPGHSIIPTGGRNSMSAVSSAPFGSALILLISYGYLKMLGRDGIKKATQAAILNANYLRVKLENEFPILYKGKNGMAAHEMIIDFREFKKTAGVEVEDIAKRLMDYGFHAPTVSFPVAGTLMVEPTESESMAELDRFIEAMLSIKQEIKEIELGIVDMQDNVLKRAPHPADVVISDNWNRSYSREKAVYPLGWVKDRKYWPPVSRIDNAYGDRNLICTCPPIEEYA